MGAGELLSHLECSSCRGISDPTELHTVCPLCGRPLLARYNLGAASIRPFPAVATSIAQSLWRYAELLPVMDPSAVVSLGEGGTPLVLAARLAAAYGTGNLWIKDESLNPTGSFKARGISVAVSRARELGVREVVTPSAGNAALAVSAYAAKAGMTAHVFVPRDAPKPFVSLCRALGAYVRLVDGLITDCGQAARESARGKGWFDLSTMREPYRVEGKKTMGFEIAEALDWVLPDVIVYPTGGGTGLVGMWKAFQELESLGLIDRRRPRMVAVQAEGCAPLVRAFSAGERFAAPWEGAESVAAGIRVPSAIGDFLILEAVRESGGTAVSVSDAELLAGQRDIMRYEGILACPEGGAAAAAIKKLVSAGWITSDDSVVLFNTGTGASYPEAVAAVAELGI